MGGAFALSLFFWAWLPVAASAGEARDPRLEAVADSRYWRVLVHYRRSIFGIDRSEIDGPEFFFSPDGKRDPYAELVATLKAFDDDSLQIGNLKQHPQCAFPARYRYLKAELGLATRDRECADFRHWFGRFNARSATFVFAAPFLGNPASIFGHTFLRIDSAPRGDAGKNDLLDYGISFEAITGDSGGVGLAVFGLLGFFPGIFTQHPYFNKTKDYTVVDNRDIWEYQLALAPAEIERMLYHVWELGNARFDYYFFDDNCAYALLGLLETARPEWDLRGEFPLWVIPSDTARALKKAGALRSATFRPSTIRKLNAQVEALSALDKKSFDDYANGSERAEGKLALAAGASAPLLDALIQFDTFRTSPNPKVSRDLLVARAQSPGDAALVRADTEENKPDTGHESMKLAPYVGIGGGGAAGSGSYGGLFFRPVVHDLLDSDQGYLPWSTLVIARTDLRILFDEKRVRLPELTVAEVFSLAPVDAIRRRASWMIAGGVATPPDYQCGACSTFHVRGAYGYSAHVLPENRDWIAFAMAKANLEYGGRFEENYRAGPALFAGSLYRIAPNWKLYANAEYRYYPMEKGDHSRFLRLAAETAYAPADNFELRIESSRTFLRSGVALYEARSLLGVYF